MNRTLVACALSAVPCLAQAGPFATINQGTLARAAALPALGQGRVLAAGARELELSYEVINEFLAFAEGGETLFADGETSRLALRWRAGAERFDWGVELPLLHVGGGYLDGFIEDWHDWFSLPTGGRELSARGAYRFRYVRDGALVFDRSEEGTALGDVRVDAGVALGEGLAVRALVKLPTGSRSRLTGGNPGGAAWLDWQGGDDSLGGFASLGLSAASDGEPLPGLQRALVPLAGAGAHWRALESVELAAQVYAHGPLYEGSELDALTRPGVQIVLGGALVLSDKSRLELAIQEDLVTRSSPDFSLRLAWRVTGSADR